MKIIQRLALCLTGSLLLLGLGIPCLTHGQTVPGKAEVRAITGTATYSTGGAPGQPLKVGMILAVGTTIKTGSESTVDLFLGNSAGVIRVAERSTLSLDKLTLTDTGADTAVEVQLNLPDGQMFFNVNKLSQASRYEIKVPSGIAGIRGTFGTCKSDATWALLQGTLIFVHAPAGQQPKTYILGPAPPAVYFTPAGGITPLPEDLKRGIQVTIEGLVGTLKLPEPTPGVPPKEPFLSPVIKP